MRTQCRVGDSDEPFAGAGRVWGGCAEHQHDVAGVVARRSARIHNGAARVHLRLRRAGRYSVTVVDPGPPPRTGLLRLRVVSSR